jgi:hypothetical protein
MAAQKQDNENIVELMLLCELNKEQWSSSYLKEKNHIRYLL